jgi:UDP-N-acetylglucosamine--N-acetylmuramyl-(pentapeptide) pyrophosphoryl-undecaprenol N-acetylglucosamine transferase
MGIPIFIQEQNAHAGVTNKILSKKAKAVFTAYPKVEGFRLKK